MLGKNLRPVFKASTIEVILVNPEVGTCTQYVHVIM